MPHEVPRRRTLERDEVFDLVRWLQEKAEVLSRSTSDHLRERGRHAESTGDRILDLVEGHHRLKSNAPPGSPNKGNWGDVGELRGTEATKVGGFTKGSSPVKAKQYFKG